MKKRDYPEVKKIYEKFDVVEKDADVCIAIGGDGTLLRAAMEFDGPILPIGERSRKSLGFYSDFGIDELDEALQQLMEGFSIEEYRKLEFEFKNKKYSVVNEVRVFRGNNPRSLHIGVYFADKKERFFPRDVKGDGLICASRLGSTAYNLNVYGPILRIDAMVVTPISARVPPIVTDEDLLIEITKNSGRLEYDSAPPFEIGPGDYFTVGLSEETVKIVRLKKRESFHEKLERLSEYLMF